MSGLDLDRRGAALLAGLFFAAGLLTSGSVGMTADELETLRAGERNLERIAAAASGRPVPEWSFHEITGFYWVLDTGRALFGRALVATVLLTVGIAMGFFGQRAIEGTANPAAAAAQPERYLLHVASGAPAAEGRAVEEEVAGPRVLVVDDDPAARDLLRRALEREGFAVTTAASGEEGLRLARTLHPAAITLDVMMPGLDGWAVLRELKDDAATAGIPVVVVSVLKDGSLAYALGAAGFLSKPVSSLSVSDRIRFLLFQPQENRNNRN